MAEAGNGSDGTTEAGTRKAPPTEPEPQQQLPPKGPVCTVAFCPICMAVSAAQGAAPDALEHLLAAAREFFLAARAVIDARGDDLSGSGQEPEPSRRFERIDIS